MKIAVICEFTGTVRDAFRRRGHEAVSFDLLPSETDGPHVVGDVRNADLSGFDAAVCHPPCTRLCNSGVRWLHERNLWQELREAREFFLWCLNLPIPRVAVENPIPHKYAELPPYTQIVQPWQFGHGETKATCLWLRGLLPLVPTSIVSGRKGRVHNESPGPDRWKKRSATYLGIAEAMAEQWTNQRTP
jgi:hypothetical protein